MSWTNAILILPAAQRDAGDALSVAMGHADLGVSTYSARLGAGDVVTHYACHTWVRDAFRETIEAAQGGSYPAWPPEMLALAQSVIPHLLAEFATEPGVMLSLDDVAALHGLERVPREAPD